MSRCRFNKKSNVKLDELVKYVITDTSEINGTNIGNWKYAKLAK